MYLYAPIFPTHFCQGLQNPMPLNLDTEIVATAYDPSTDSCAYTIERNGKRWTVQVPLVQLDACGANKQPAATILATCCSPPWMARPMTRRRMPAPETRLMKNMPIRATYVMRNGRLVRKRKTARPSAAAGPQIMSDIAPYRTAATDVATGRRAVIGGRRQHREFLRRNGYVELGNDYVPPQREEMSRAERITDIRRVLEH